MSVKFTEQQQKRNEKYNKYVEHVTPTHSLAMNMFKAFILGGNNYFAPIQRTEDFMNNRKSEYIGTVKPTYTPGVTLSNLNEILPKFVSDTLKEGILEFDKRLSGFANPDSILTGVETRSSSPVRILRNEKLTSNISGIYPCGEGAGYAGGIMSASVDGIKCAIALMEA